MEVTVKSTQDTKKLADELVSHIKVNDVVALYGDLGSGKTTFTKYLVVALGFESRVQSPTFVVVRRYMKKNGHIKVVNHIDLYRLGTVEEVTEIGLEELFTENNAITIIEWPEIAEHLLPPNTIKIKFKDLGEDKRKIIIDKL